MYWKPAYALLPPHTFTRNDDGGPGWIVALSRNPLFMMLSGALLLGVKGGIRPLNFIPGALSEC
ncbi:MAG: hypothetical protein ACLR0U_00205 [Enterocloster clostridioformis]